ncbi:fibronectin-binding protein EfbA [Enterococcus massiliensis]|uniref:fibronectin-binding protein EfbA n=1 Tax=Enterococcus massiliensis TaxID=1640685 RepID=UPI00065DC234|nr:fibronectin-binding protein EfbA [Enterococcus massiliensis]
MSFDGVFTHLMIEELSKELVRGRISKIHQPYTNEIILVIRNQGKNKKLLLSAHPSYARVQLTNIAYANPDTPPNFIMMLRKYLDGAILERIHQINNDRVIHFTFSRRDELGDLQNIVLIVELMGRHSTILLMNQETGKILDAIKHIGASQNTYRSLLPGVDYVEPPKQDLLNPFTASDPVIFDRLSKAPELTKNYLQQQFQGLGADTATELAFRLNQAPNEKLRVWHDFFQTLEEKLSPTLVLQEKKDFFTPVPYQTLIEDAEIQTTETISQLLDLYYHDKAERDRVKQQGSELLRKMENELTRNKKKLLKREKTLADSENAEEFRQKGELLTTFMTQVPRGATSVELPNYYEEDRLMTIALNPAWSPNQNAQKYFQRYQKLRNAVKLIGEQIRETKEEIAYLESVLAQLEIAGPMDVEIIREELQDQGYLKKPAKRQKKNKKSQPEIFYATDGTEILVGKNNLQNDQLTLRTARKTDFWLHAKNIPGSHVIIRSNTPSEETILEAAELAAYFSKYRYSAQVPVDLVQVKYIHKPNGAKPGYVIYENQKTYFITPEEEAIQERTKKPTA